jgi:hypothetical protein
MRPDTRDAGDLAAKVAVAREFPVAELSFYHYGLAPLEALDWIRQALTGERDAGISRGPRPAPRG